MMKKMDTKARIRMISMVLFLAVAVVWAVFYTVISGYISEITNKQITLAADQIIERLGNEFSQAEYLAYSLINNSDVKGLALGQEPDRRYALGESIVASLDVGVRGSEFVEDVILYGGTEYYRLAGKLGNKSCALLSGLIPTFNLPSHFSVELEGGNYIGYADVIADHAGYIVTLIEEEKILEVMHAYDQSGDLLIKIEGDNGVVAANTDRLDWFGSENVPIIRSRLDITPYEITVTVGAQYMSNSMVYFTVVAVITAAIFGVVLLMYSDVMNKRFFRPLVQVIGSIELLNTKVPAQTLPHVRNEEFDGLVDKINEMLQHIEEKNRALLEAEADRQSALMLSFKKQINAHFTVNTLDTIRILVRNGETDKAETIAEGLVSLFRYAYDKDELVNIWDEYDILQAYADIMNYRYDGRLKIDFDFDTALMDEDYRMPRMLLQPVIENAIIYGFREPASSFLITVTAGFCDRQIVFSVSDNGRGMSTEALRSLIENIRVDTESVRGYENIALRNIRNRLYYYYGDAGKLTIQENDGGGIAVSINIPAIPAGRTGGTM